MKGPETPHRFQSLSYLNLLQASFINCFDYYC